MYYVSRSTVKPSNNTHLLGRYLFASLHLLQGWKYSIWYCPVTGLWEESSSCGKIWLHPVNTISMMVEVFSPYCLSTPFGAVGTTLLSYTPPWLHQHQEPEHGSVSPIQLLEETRKKKESGYCVEVDLTSSNTRVMTACSISSENLCINTTFDLQIRPTSEYLNVIHCIVYVWGSSMIFIHHLNILIFSRESIFTIACSLS